MMRKILLTSVVVFVVWSILDFVIHGVLLQSAYAATPQLWRPHAEMKLGVLYVSVFGGALAFTAIWTRFVRPKSAMIGILYGTWFGLAAGLSMGYGSYAVMPIPYGMALVWFLGQLVEGIVAGAVVATLIRE
ncbi:MAG: hypothetical protein ACM3JJ_03375 [Hyphomicrobiales bacterium]